MMRPPSAKTVLSYIDAIERGRPPRVAAGIATRFAPSDRPGLDRVRGRIALMIGEAKHRAGVDTLPTCERERIARLVIVACAISMEMRRAKAAA